ncbi:MAG: hypothetical protein Q9175_004528 [Cornicularia normoerica]
MPHSISFSVNRASAAMSSHAVGSRIPVHVNDSVVAAAASRPPVNIADNIATLFSAMSISKPTTVKPTSASPSTSHASKSMLPVIAATSATKGCPPLRQHRQRSLAKIAPSVNSVSVSDRIAERRQRVIAKLAPGSKRPTPLVKVTPTSTLKSFSTSSRVPSLTAISAKPGSTLQTPLPSLDVVVPGAVIPAAAPASTSDSSPTPLDVPVHVAVIPAAVAARRQYGWVTVEMPENYRQGTDGERGHISHIVQISDEVFYAESLIPSASTGRKPRARLPGRSRPATIPLTRTTISHQLSPVFLPHTMTQFPQHFPPVYLPLRLKPDKVRGTSDYCPARPRFEGKRGAYGYGILHKGRTCKCCEDDGHIPLECYNIPPNQWATTPAESGVDPHPRKVRTMRPRKVLRFADNLIHTFAGVRDPAASFVWKGRSKDTTTREEDFPEGFPLYEDDPKRRLGFRRL